MVVQSKNGFKAERAISFKYIRIGSWWLRVRKKIDRHVKKVVGIKNLRIPLILKAPLPPQSLARPLHTAIARHKLDGGVIYELLGQNDYQATITVVPRRVKAHE